MKLRSLIKESISNVTTKFDHDKFRADLKQVVRYADCTYRDSTGILIVYLDDNPNVERNAVNKLVRTKYPDSLKRMSSELDKMQFKVISEGFQGDNDNANNGMSGFRGNGSAKKYSELQLSGLMMKLANWLHKNKNASGTDILSKINDLIESIK